ncbi:MAG: phosphoribosylanthranilate isomerase [Candidatus Helarchaeota archaeon]
MTKIKICGLKTYEDALYVHHIGADALGFIIDVPVDTPRKISSQVARDIITQLPLDTVTVGVILPSQIKEILHIIEETNVDAIQIHGTVNPKVINEIKAEEDISIIISYLIDKKTNITEAIEAIEEYIANGSDAILLDTKSKKYIGGTGKIHDWKKSKEIKDSFNCPFILAGGLNPENVLDAIREVEPYAIDVSSGVESAPGVKDRRKIKELIQKVRLF